MSATIHPTAIVEPGAVIGAGAKIWHYCHVRAGAVIGEECVLGKGVYIDAGVNIGRRTKIQNNVSVFHGVVIEEGVFIGPHVCFTNDLFPRAVTPDGRLRGEKDWTVVTTTVCRGAGIGANSTIVAGTVLGSWCLVGAGSVVTSNVAPYALVYGNPARVKGIVAPSGERLSTVYRPGVYTGKSGGEEVRILPEWADE